MSRKHDTHTYLEPDLKPVERVQTIRTNDIDFDYGDEDAAIPGSGGLDQYGRSIYKATLDIDGELLLGYPPEDNQLYDYGNIDPPIYETNAVSHDYGDEDALSDIYVDDQTFNYGNIDIYYPSPETYSFGDEDYKLSHGNYNEEGYEDETEYDFDYLSTIEITEVDDTFDFGNIEERVYPDPDFAPTHSFGDEDEYAEIGYYSDDGYIEGADYDFDELAWIPDEDRPYADYQDEDYIDELDSDFDILLLVEDPEGDPHIVEYNYEFSSEDENVFIESAKLISRIGADLVRALLKDKAVKTFVHDNGIPEEVFNPHIIIHFAFNRRMNRMFMEFTFDHYLNRILHNAGKYDEYMTKLINRVNANYYESITKCRGIIFNPKTGIPTNSDNYGVSNILTLGTVSYWKNLNGNYEFLNDYREVESDIEKYKMVVSNDKEYHQKIKDFYTQMKNINRDLLLDSIDIEEAFKTYANFYNTEFDTEIKRLESTEIQRFERYDERFLDYADTKDFDYGEIENIPDGKYATSHDYGDEDVVGDPLSDTNHFNYLDLSDQNTEISTEMHGFGDEDEYVETGSYSDEGYEDEADYDFDELAEHLDYNDISYVDEQSEDYIDNIDTKFADQDTGIPFSGLEYSKNTNHEKQHEYPVHKFEETVFYVDFLHLFDETLK